MRKSREDVQGRKALLEATFSQKASKRAFFAGTTTNRTTNWQLSHALTIGSLRSISNAGASSLVAVSERKGVSLSRGRTEWIQGFGVCAKTKYCDTEPKTKPPRAGLALAGTGRRGTAQPWAKMAEVSSIQTCSALRWERTLQQRCLCVWGDAGSLLSFSSHPAMPSPYSLFCNLAHKQLPPISSLLLGRVHRPHWQLLGTLENPTQDAFSRLLHWM